MKAMKERLPKANTPRVGRAERSPSGGPFGTHEVIVHEILLVQSQLTLDLLAYTVEVRNHCRLRLVPRTAREGARPERNLGRASSLLVVLVAVQSDRDLGVR